MLMLDNNDFHNILKALSLLINETNKELKAKTFSNMQRRCKEANLLGMNDTFVKVLQASHEFREYKATRRGNERVSSGN